MTYFNWGRGQPSNDKGKEDHIVMRWTDRGRWNDEEDTTGYMFFRKMSNVVCQDVTVPGMTTIMFIRMLQYQV